MAIREYIKKYNADEVLFCLAVIFKPLYLLPSGSFQIGDFLFIAAVAVHFLAGSERELLFPIHKEEHSLLIFVSGVLVINFTYWILIGTSDFLINSVYYLFNFLIVLYAADVILSDRKPVFLQGLSNSCKLVIAVQLLIYILGLGGSQTDGRYVGTFNDPNQFAVYILFCLFAILDIYHKINLTTAIWFVLCVALIIPSGSTGALMSLIGFLVMVLLLSAATINKRKALVGIIGIFAIAAIMTVALSTGNQFVSTEVLGRMNARLEEKLSNATSLKDMMNFLINDRVWNRVFEQPKYLLYGAGEGAHIRFAHGFAYEIHSSILGPLFYYGIGIAVFMFRWIAIKLKHIDSFQACIYIAIIAESMLLVNYRQPLFWLLFVLAGRDKTNKLSISRINEAEYVDPVIVQKVRQRV